jgi:hypothetical protein
MYKRTLPRAAGVSPPWFGNANAGQRESSNVRGLANTQPRAAGVSPPWCVPRTVADQNRTMLADGRTRNQERRASARRGVCGERLRMKIEQCSLAVEHAIESGGREPAVARKCLASGPQLFPTRMATVRLPWERNGVALPSILARTRTPACHGGLTPPAPGCMRDTSPAICFSDSQRRMFPTGG